MRAEHRAYLRAIIESPDSDVRPADRIKCVELLRGEPDDDRDVAAEIRSEVARKSDAELDREVDCLAFAPELDALLAGDPVMLGRFPNAAAVAARWRERLSDELTRGAVPELLARVERLEEELREAHALAASAPTELAAGVSPGPGGDGRESPAERGYSDAELFPPPVFPDERPPGRNRRR